MKLFSKIKQQIEALCNLAKESGWTYSPPLIEFPATKEEILKVESDIGVNFPQDLATLFLECSRHIEFRYRHNLEIPNEFKGLSSGELSWNLDDYVNQYQYYKGWIEASLDPEIFDYEMFEEQKELMYNKVPLIEVFNGDLIVVGYNPSEVIYFSHEWAELHGKRLGNTLFEFLEYYTQVGFTGPEDWKFEPFLTHSSSNVIYDQNNITKWQKLLGINNL